MKTGKTCVTALFVLASFPLVAQPPTANRPPTQQTAPGAEGPPTSPAGPNSPAAVPEATAGAKTSAAEMSPVMNPVLSPVNGELISKLDSKTAKTGDSVVLQTKTSVKTGDGTEIPKGSKLVGHVMGVQASGAGQNSQVALQFDHAELKGGQNVPIQSQIESIAPAGGAVSAAGPAMGAGPASSAPVGGAASPNAGAANGAGRNSGVASAGGGGVPAAGTIVARTGNIAIQTTSVPGVLVANNAPGQHDPRMAQLSSILLGAKRDIQLDGGTEMVVGVAAANGGAK